MISLDPLRPYLLAIKVGAGVLAVLLVFGLGWNRGADRWQGKFDGEVAAHKATKSEHARVIRDLADKAKSVAAQEKAASEQAKADRKATDQRFRESQREADRAKRDLAAALRRGTGAVRLQDHWACRLPGSAAGDLAAAAGRQAAGADLRAAGAADLVAAGDAADRWIVWLQSEVTMTRKACGVAP